MIFDTGMVSEWDYGLSQASAGQMRCLLENKAEDAGADSDVSDVFQSDQAHSQWPCDLINTGSVVVLTAVGHRLSCGNPGPHPNRRPKT